MTAARPEGETPLRVVFTQSGGFAGIVRGCTLDGAGMEPAEREELARLVAESGLDAPLEALSAASRDRKQYALEITRGDALVNVVCDDASLPGAARPLVAFLAARARPITPR